MTLILGIDPGSRVTGYGLVAMEKQHCRHVAHGCVDMAELPLAARLREIYSGLSTVIGEHAPEEVAIEKVFMSRNPDSAIKLGQARGAAIVAVAMNELPLYEYAPNAIKQAVVGRGHATKEQVQHMVRALLNLSGRMRADAADALAVAICHGHTRQSVQFLARAQAGVAP